MRVGRNVIISVILALSAAGSIGVSVVAPATVAQGASVHVVAGSSHAIPQTYFHG
jgi:hypothetical protein